MSHDPRRQVVKGNDPSSGARSRGGALTDGFCAATVAGPRTRGTVGVHVGVGSAGSADPLRGQSARTPGTRGGGLPPHHWKLRHQTDPGLPGLDVTLVFTAFVRCALRGREIMYQ